MSDQPPPPSDQPPPRARRLQIGFGLILLAAALAAGLFAWRAATRPSDIHIAFGNSLTGDYANLGAEALAGARLYVDEVNRGGGIDGHRIVFDEFDDRTSPEVARANARLIADGPALAVLGHLTSAVSLAAAAEYKAAQIPALTSQAAADALTLGNSWCFRAATPSLAQAQWLASYIRHILQSHSSPLARAADIDLVISNDAYGLSFSRGYFTGSEGQSLKVWTADQNPKGAATSVATIADSLAEEPEPRIILIAVQGGGANSVDLVKAIRRRGIRTIIVVTAAGSDDYLRSFENEPEERDTPGFFTDNLYTMASIIFDTVGSLGQQYAERYAAATGKRPSFIGANSNNAMRLLVEALRRARPVNTPESKSEDRRRIRDALASIDSPEQGIPGLDGPLYFNASRDMPRSLRFGVYDRGRLVSAPLQLVTVRNPDLVDLPKEIAAGHIVNIGDQFFWLQRVVYAGIDIARLDDVELKTGIFNADFYVWLRYGGDDDAPTHIEFPGLKTGGFDPSHPTEAGRQDDLNYRLWRVSGDFKADFDLHDFPFDSQTLILRFQNHEAPREQIAYVIDTFGLHLHRPKPGPVDASNAFRDLQLWHVTDLRYYVDAFSINSTQGKTAFFDTDNRDEFGGFDTAIVVQRDVLAFIVKTLVPLFLLVLVVFATLFFPINLTSSRTSVPVTGILTSAVLLNSISSQLPPLGYTMALEYIFYVFFGLCLMAMCSAFIGDILRGKTYHGHAIAVDQIARFAYVGVVFLTIAFFVWRYVLA